jgi:hypothetical protein
MSGGGTNTVQQTLPSWLQPYLTSELSQAQSLTPGLSGTGPTTYTDPATGQTVTTPGSPGVSSSSLVAPLNQTQQQGIGSMISAASNPQNPVSSASAANQFETSGALLDPNSNPWLQNTFNLAANNVQNQLSTEFAGNGSNVINSLPVQSDQMNDLATQLFGGAYQQGVDTMTKASALAPTIEQGTFMPGQELLQAGNIGQQQQQQLINAPYNAMSWYSGLLGLNGSSLGGSSQSNNPNAAMQDAGIGIGALGALADAGIAFGAVF